MRKSAILIAMALAPALTWGAAATRPSGAAKARPSAERLERRLETHAHEWPDAYQFFEQHSPLRAKAFEEMSEKQKEKFRPLIMERYASMKLTGKGDAQLQKLREQQLEIEDGIFGLKQNLMKPNVSADTAEHLKKQLRGLVKDLVEARIKERELRLARLEGLITREKDLLTTDQKHKDQLIEKRYEEVLNAKNADAAASDHPRPRRAETDRPAGKPAQRK